MKGNKGGNKGSPSISRQLAQFIHKLSFDGLPPHLIEKAKSRILDALSTAIAGRGLPVPTVALELVRNHKGRATIFGHEPRVPAMDAAFVNATLTNGRSQDDFLYKSHPGALTIPAAMAIAEEHGNSGTEVITSVILGYEIVGRVFLGGPTMLPKFRASGVAGTLGAAATAGKLLRLDEDQLKDALGCAAVFSSGFGEGFLSGTMEVKLNVGMASRNGVTAALLAQKGATAAETSLEGKSGFYQAFAGTPAAADAMTADLGKRFLINEVVYKECPACIFVQTPIYLAGSLAKQKNIKGQDIQKVIVTVGEPTFNNPGFRNVAPFQTHLQAVTSARFCTAAALLARPVTSYEFFDEYEDPMVLELAEKIELVEEKKDNGWVQIEMFLKNGRRYKIEGIEGETLTPTADKIRKKFESLTTSFLGKRKVSRVIDLVFHLDQLKKIRELTEELRP